MIFIYGELKNKFYSTEITLYEDLMQRINNLITEMQQNSQEICIVINSILHRCQACIVAQEQHFEIRY